MRIRKIKSESETPTGYEEVSKHDKQINFTYIFSLFLFLNVAIGIILFSLNRDENTLAEDIKCLSEINVVLEHHTSDMHTSKDDVNQVLNTLNAHKAVLNKQLYIDVVQLGKEYLKNPNHNKYSLLVQNIIPLKEDVDLKLKVNETELRDYKIKYITVFVAFTILGSFVFYFLFQRLKRSNDILYKTSNTDVLTGLNNRRKYLNDLTVRVQFAKSKNKFFSVIFMDVDRFKQTNDTFGHKVGDELLKNISDILVHETRNKDIAGRIAGDEFSIITTCYDSMKDAEVGTIGLVERLDEAILALREASGMDISISMGVAIYPIDGKSETDILNAADTAMYKSKKQSYTNSCIFFDREAERETERLEAEIVSAMKFGHFHIEYQPKVNIYTNKCVGLEALFRLQSSNGDTIEPDVFIPFLEKGKLMDLLGVKLIDTIVKDLPDFNGLPIAINISPSQLRHDATVKYLEKVVEEKGLRNVIEVELTEQTVIKEHNRVKELAKMPITLTIDDFGMGYSALSYIYEFKGLVDVIKIDRYFSQKILESSGFEILKTIVNLSKHFKYDVIVEGIETEKQLTKLKELGRDVEVVQGFYFSEPLKKEGAIKYIDSLG